MTSGNRRTWGIATRLAGPLSGGLGCTLWFCLAILAGRSAALAQSSWRMAGANPQRTGWVAEEVRGTLHPAWYRPIEAYIGQCVQLIAANDRIYVASARGLYALNAADGAVSWRFDTQLPVGHSPTIDGNVCYIAGYDRKIHALNASTGAHLWSFDGAQAGFCTNPLVVNGRVYAGCRDGFMYAIIADGQANAGTLAWKFQAGGPILCSAAISGTTLYFAANDCRAYALNANTGQLLWKSAKLPTRGFHSWWPVICGNYVIFSGGINYIYGGPQTIGDFTNGLERDDMLPLAGDLGLRGTEPGPWAAGTVTMDASKAVDHFAQKPWRRTSFVLRRSDGAEMRLPGSAGVGGYAPILPCFSKTGNRYPPVIGADGVPYQVMMYRRNTSGQYDIPRAMICGWKIGTSTVSLVGHDSAVDEPMALSAGGNVIYSTLCCDRVGQWQDYTIPLNGANRQRTLWQYSQTLRSLCPGYDVMWAGVTDPVDRLRGEYGTTNGIYHLHGDQNPLIPYKGMLFVHRSNSVIAFSLTGTSIALPKLTINPVTDTISRRTTEQLRAMLEAQVQKIIAAGHLQPGFYNAGQFDISWTVNGGLAYYFQRPADTFHVLSRAMPHLSTQTQTLLLAYLASEYQAHPPNSVYEYGWNSGAQRAWSDIPPDLAAAKFNTTDRTTPGVLPPETAYGLWKYAQVANNALAVYNSIKNRIQVPCPIIDDTLVMQTYELNRYIAGYTGYLALEAMAGQPPTAAMSAELTRLKNLWVARVAKDSPYSTGSISQRHLNVCRNFIWMTPELAAYLRANCLGKVQDMVSEFSWIEPYWFAAEYEGSIGEGAIHMLHDVQALYLAKALILQDAPVELDKFLDVPAFEKGDLIYLLNLITLLDSPEPAPIAAPRARPVQRHDQ